MNVIIADGYSTGRFLPAALAERGIGCVHVRSTPTVPMIYAGDFEPDSYVASLPYNRDVRVIAKQAALYDPAVVIAGTESGVTLAEELAAELSLPHNGATTRGARRDKSLMAAAVADAGLAVADWTLCATADELAAWAEARDRWPVVVKPVDSAGTDNVYICGDRSSLLVAFNRVRRARTLFGTPNETVMIQEFLAGDEYFVNSVSRDGEHHVAEVWRYHKIEIPGRGRIYDYEEPVPPDSPVAARLGEYVCAVLNALEVRYGPAHTEVMWTPEGPVLIECGARLAGSVLPAPVRRCFGVSQLDLTAALISDPGAFSAAARDGYRVRGSLRYVWLVAEAGGVIAPDAADLVGSLPSYAGFNRPLRGGQPVTRTVDSLTSPGAVYLYHPDPAVVAADYTTLRQWEAERLYIDA